MKSLQSEFGEADFDDEQHALSLFKLKETFNKCALGARDCVEVKCDGKEDILTTDEVDMIQDMIDISYKPIDVVLGGCLKFNKVRSKIILNPKPEDPVPRAPKNVIINWEKQKCVVKERIRILGTENCNPDEYKKTYGEQLIPAEELPEIANKVGLKAAQTNSGKVLAAETSHKYFNELEGDIHALKMIDLDKEGLSEYKYILDQIVVEENQSN